MEYIIHTPEEAQAMREAIRIYEYKQYGWKYFAQYQGKIEGIRCHRFLNGSSLSAATREVTKFLDELIGFVGMID